MLTKNDILLFTGDSITDCGRNRTEEDIHANAAGWGYANLLKADILYNSPYLELTIYNRGIGGNRVVDLYARAKEDCYNLHPNIISILIGINDLWAEYRRGTGVEVEKFRKIYDIMLNKARERLPDVKLVLCEPFSLKGGLEAAQGNYDAWRSELEERQNVVKELAQKHNAIFVPLQSAFNAACAKAPDTYWLYDGVHPTEAGHMLIAQVWKESVLK
ncbi:MAG: SGNH/GDSL hydrolase family protein [Defluviitaleaceae bacterium]|nr:SGNH/GDSL hydrolase family protein [Defluviitaleaceae bacterium]